MKIDEIDERLLYEAIREGVRGAFLDAFRDDWDATRKTLTDAIKEGVENAISESATAEE